MGIFQESPCRSPREVRRWFAAPLKEDGNRISVEKWAEAVSSCKVQSGLLGREMIVLTCPNVLLLMLKASMLSIKRNAYEEQCA